MQSNLIPRLSLSCLSFVFCINIIFAQETSEEYLRPENIEERIKDYILESKTQLYADAREELKHIHTYPFIGSAKPDEIAIATQIQNTNPPIPKDCWLSKKPYPKKYKIKIAAESHSCPNCILYRDLYLQLGKKNIVVDFHEGSPAGEKAMKTFNQRGLENQETLALYMLRLEEDTKQEKDNPENVLQNTILRIFIHVPDETIRKMITSLKDVLEFSALADQLNLLSAEKLLSPDDHEAAIKLYKFTESLTKAQKQKYTKALTLALAEAMKNSSKTNTPELSNIEIVVNRFMTEKVTSDGEIKYDPFLITYRNHLWIKNVITALCSKKSEDFNKDIVLVVGAAHAPGLIDKFKKTLDSTDVFLEDNFQKFDQMSLEDRKADALKILEAIHKN